MKEILDKKDIYKEVLTVLSYFDAQLLEKIPIKVFNRLKEFAADSSANIHIDIEKGLDEQNISEESKDIISLIYYMCIADETEKRKLYELFNEYN